MATLLGEQARWVQGSHGFGLCLVTLTMLVCRLSLIFFVKIIDQTGNSSIGPKSGEPSYGFEIAGGISYKFSGGFNEMMAFNNQAPI